VAVARSWLEDLERSLAADEEGESLAVAVVVLAFHAGHDVSLDEDELRPALRRAVLLLAAGGDPARGIDLNGRAVHALADDLDDSSRRAALELGLGMLRVDAAGLPHVSEALRGLVEAPDVAWRAYVCALLAQDLAGEE
jgi:hypothetical protein